MPGAYNLSKLFSSDTSKFVILCAMQSKSILNYLSSFFLLLTFITYFLAESGKVNNFPTYLLGLCVLYAVITDREVRQLFIHSSVLQWSFLILTYFAFSSFWSNQVEWVGLAKAFSNVPLLLGFMLGILICDRAFAGFTTLLIRILVLSATVSALYSIYLYMEVGYQPSHEDRMYAMGRLGSPVMSALSYGIVVVFAIHMFLGSNDKVKQTGWLGCALILMYAIFLTGTVGVWIGVLLSLTTTHALHRKLNLNQIILRLAMTLVLGILFVVGIYFLVPDLYAALFPRSFSFRPEIWSGAISRTLDHNAMFGFGHLDTGNMVMGNLEFHHAHSIYLSSFYYGGFIGLFLLLCLIVTAFLMALNSAFGGTASNNSGPVQNGMPNDDGVGDRTLNLTHLSLSTLVYGCLVFALDGDRLLEKVDLVWLVFWLPISLCAISELRYNDAQKDATQSG
jgi:O-antigen ligase